MDESQLSETSHEHRVTWSLMAVVIAFVLVMTCIVLWITSSLIKNEFGQTDATAWPTATTPAAPSPTPTEVPETQAVIAPAVDNPTWTPVATYTAIPGRKRYVRFVTYKVSKSKINLGECVQIRWDTQFAAKLELYRDGEILLEDAPISTTIEECPNRTGYVVYRLVGTNAYDETNWVQLQVRVVNAP